MTLLGHGSKLLDLTVELLPVLVSLIFPGDREVQGYPHLVIHVVYIHIPQHVKEYYTSSPFNLSISVLCMTHVVPAFIAF